VSRSVALGAGREKASVAQGVSRCPSVTQGWAVDSPKPWPVGVWWPRHQNAISGVPGVIAGHQADFGRLWGCLPSMLLSRPCRHRPNHIIRRQRPPYPLQFKLADGLNLHGVLDLGQHSGIVRILESAFSMFFCNAAIAFASFGRHRLCRRA
jgi:hypothetical protein